MPYSQCRTKTQITKESWFVRLKSCHGFDKACDRVVTPSPRHNVDSWVMQSSFWAKRKNLFFLLEQQMKTLFFPFKPEEKETPFSFVTDLSAAGSPAELKHITQRRKRKQP